jgi:3-phosphoshikimate 1-carboxyvinyltransferase
MTEQLIKTFPQRNQNFQVEPDASSGSYFWAVNLLNPVVPGEILGAPKVSVAHWPVSGWQVDANFPGYLPLPPRLSRQEHLGDSIMTAIALAPLAAHPIRFEHLGRLRVQECERVQALKTELTRCGATVIEEGDTLMIHPSTLHGAEIETYDDHRMAMSFAILGLKVPGIRLKNPACVRKTFPNFFQKLAALPPDGLGATVLDVTAGGRVPLEGSDLIAD